MAETTRQRLADALVMIGHHYALPAPPVERPVECLTFLAEALAAILVELPPTRVMGRRRAEQKASH
jgi:hypothetical protein